jgi:DNA modification methylase
MQETLLQTHAFTGNELADARQDLERSLQDLNLTPEDHTYLTNLLDIFANKPNLSPDAFSRQIVSYVKNCVLQIHMPDRQMRTASNIKQLDRRLEPIRKNALSFSRMASGDISQNETIDNIDTIPTGSKATNRTNDLDGATWLKYSVSVWDDLGKTQEEYAFAHPAMFPSELPDRLIQMFMTRNAEKTILDPFMGSGATLVAAVNNHKLGVGFELYDDFIQLAQKRLTGTLNFSEKPKEFRIIKDDARNLKNYFEPESIDMCITSPPYWNILSQKRTADYKEIRKYGDAEKDLGEIASYQDFLAELQKVFKQVFVALKPNSYCVVNVMDLRKQADFYAYHVDVIDFMRQIGFDLDDIIIWNRNKEYNNLRPLGYPFVFRVNKVHEFILIFKKPKSTS